MSTVIRHPLCRQSPSRALLAAAVWAGAMAVAGSIAEAGVMVPWEQRSGEFGENLLSEFTFAAAPGDSPGALAPTVATEARRLTPIRDGGSPDDLTVPSETGGASAPATGSSGQTTLVPPALLNASPTMNAVPPSFACRGECCLTLPRPPLNELLDPPKLGV